jgi:hypothetical protein
VARRQRLAHPGEQPAGREERVARRADRQHPDSGRGSDLHAEGEDQEGIDLAVHPRPQRRLGPGAPCDPSVGEVERERKGRQRHERRDRRVTLAGAHGQRRDAYGERRPGERQPACRAEPRRSVAPESTGEREVEEKSGRDSDEPAGAPEADRFRERRQKQQLGAQPGQRPWSRPQRCSALDHPSRSTVSVVHRFGARP